MPQTAARAIAGDYYGSPSLGPPSFAKWLCLPPVSNLHSKLLRTRLRLQFSSVIQIGKRIEKHIGKEMG